MCAAAMGSPDRQTIAQQSAKGSQGTFYKCKSKYGGREPSDAKRLRQLEDDNARLKKLVAEQMLDITRLRDVNSKKWRRPVPSGLLWHSSRMPMLSASAGRVRP